MSENIAKSAGAASSSGQDKPKRAILVLRDRCCGGVPKERLERNKEQQSFKRQVKAALEKGPKTAPEVAAETGLPTERVFWQLMCMKKYGEVVEGEERDGYYEYKLAENSTDSSQE